MPLIKRYELEGGLLGVWHIEECEPELALQCTAAEREYAVCFSSPHRRREWLAWHALMHRLVPEARAGYSPQGAPVLPEGGYIGVSHCREYAAVIMGLRPCAVDIESWNRRFEHVEQRYLSLEEKTCFTPDHRLLGVIWCAKETLYKWAPRPDTDFIRDIQIERIDPQNRTLTGVIHGKRATLHDQSDLQKVLVYCME